MPGRFVIAWVLFASIALDPKRAFAVAQTTAPTPTNPACPIGEDSAVEIQLRFRLKPADRSFFTSDEATTDLLLVAVQDVLWSTLQTATAGGKSNCQNPGEIGRLQLQQISSLSLIADPVPDESATVSTSASELSNNVHILAKVEAICSDCNLLLFSEINALSIFGEQPLRRQRRNQESSPLEDLMDLALVESSVSMNGENDTSSSVDEKPFFMRQRHMQFVDVGTIPTECYCDPFIAQSSVVRIFNEALIEAESGIASIVGSTEVSPLIQVLAVSEIQSVPSSACQARDSYRPFESFVLLTMDFLFINSLQDIQADLEQGLLRAYNDLTVFRNDDDRVCDPRFRLATQVEITQQNGINGNQIDPSNVMPGNEVVLTAKITGLCRDCDVTTNLFYTGDGEEMDFGGDEDSSSFPDPPVVVEPSSSNARSGWFGEGEWGLRRLDAVAANELACLCPVDTREYRGPTSEEYLDAIRQSSVVGDQGILPISVEEVNVLDGCENPLTRDPNPTLFTEIVTLELQINCTLIDNDALLLVDAIKELYNWYSQVSFSLELCAASLSLDVERRIDAKHSIVSQMHTRVPCPYPLSLSEPSLLQPTSSGGGERRGCGTWGARDRR